MSKYDEERKKIGLKLNSEKSNNSSKSKYDQERKILFDNASPYNANTTKALKEQKRQTQTDFNKSYVQPNTIAEFKKLEPSPINTNKIPYAETYKEVPKNFKSGNILGGIGNALKGTGQMVAQGFQNIGNLPLIASKAIMGKGIDLDPNMTAESYIRDVGGEKGNQLADTAAGKALINTWGAVVDPLTWVGGGIASDVAKARKIGTTGLLNDAKTGKKVLGNIRDTQSLKPDLSLKKSDNINTRPMLESQPTKANRSVAEDIGLKNKNTTETLNILPESNRLNQSSGTMPYGTKERKFSQNVQGSKDTPEYILKQLTDEKLTYNPISEKSTLDKAAKRITENKEKAYSDVLIGTGKGISRDDVATGELLIKQAFENGDNDKAYTLISHLAEKLTESGQAIQAAAMFKRMTPEGMLLYAEKEVNKANRVLDLPGKIKGGFSDPLKKFYKRGNLTDEMKNIIRTDMEDLMKLPEGREKDVKLAQVMQTISEAMPKAPLAKLESFRTIAMLSNPKTWVRNYLSNLAFGGIEAGATKPLSALTDRVLSLRTGQRSVLNTQYKELGKGFVEGSKNAMDDVIRNIDTSPTRGALELPRANEFKNVPALREIEKAVKLGVSGGDRPFYEAAYKDALAEQIKLYEKNTGKKVLAATEEMKTTADEIAKYRTYADSNMLSNGLTKIKSGLNKMRIGGIGAGDVLMKFTRTPANLVARGIDYSPAGLVKGMVDISRVLAGNKEIQRQAAESFSRGVIGTGFVTAAITLTNLGIIQGERKKSNTANAFEQATGKGQYTFNVSALKRYIASGMNPKAAEEQQGDKISTYDWAQPLALSASVGANIGEDLKKKQKVDTLGLIGTIAESMASGANTIIEQPMLQNINRVFKGDNPVQGLLSVVQDYPASFVPAFVSGMRYAADPYIRDTSGSVLDSVGKRVINKIPFASRSLDKTTDILGKDRKVAAQTSFGRWADSALNPTRITKVDCTPVTKEIDKLYKTTKDGNILPNLVEKSDTIASPKKGEPAKELTPQQRTQYQKLLADNYLKLANDLINAPGWMLLKEDLKVDRLSSARKKSDAIAKRVMQNIIFGSQP